MTTHRCPTYRFLSRITRVESGCWLWKAAIQSGGYGSFRVTANDHWLAHRYSWRFFHGEAAVGMVLHKCDVRACVNPSHLFLGDAKSNARDALEKGRLHLDGLIPGYHGPRGKGSRSRDVGRS